MDSSPAAQNLKIWAHGTDTCGHGSIMLPWSMTSLMSPTYQLAQMQDKVRIGHFQIMKPAQEGAAELGLDEESIKECVCGLTPKDFYKTMPSKKVAGSFQDVYKTEFCGLPIYTKLSLSLGRGRKTVVISFTRDESAQYQGRERP